MARKKGSRIGIDPFEETSDEIRTVEVNSMPKQDAGQQTLKLEGVVDISKVAELKQGLAGMLAGDLAIEVDAGEVEKVDGAALQLLLAFVAEVRQRGGSLRWRAVSMRSRAKEMSSASVVSSCTFS